MTPDRGYSPYSKDFYEQIEEEITQMRDKKGKFVQGHSPVNPRDPVTGKFLPLKTVEEQVDEMLAKQEASK